VAISFGRWRRLNWVLTVATSGFEDRRRRLSRTSLRAYANSRSKYGFLSDDAFDHSGIYTHMAWLWAVERAISNSNTWRSRARASRGSDCSTDGPRRSGSEQPMANVSVHDTYVHDVDSEGLLLRLDGDPPSYLFPTFRSTTTGSCVPAARPCKSKI